MSFLGRKDRFHPFKIAAHIPDKFLLRPDRALSALTDLIMTSLTWGSHLPTGLNFCLGCMAGVPASSCATAVDVSGHGTTPHPGQTHPGPCLTVLVLTPGLCSSPSPGWGPEPSHCPLPPLLLNGSGTILAGRTLPCCPMGLPNSSQSLGAAGPHGILPASHLRLPQALSQQCRARPVTAQNLAQQTLLWALTLCCGLTPASNPAPGSRWLILPPSGSGVELEGDKLENPQFEI